VNKSQDSRANLDSNASKKPRRIVCAALRHRKYPNRIIASVRHGDAVMLSQLHRMENPADFDAGFLDSGCRFLTRAEAAVVAVAAGQVAEGNELLLAEELL
jgi:hypothetical protein